MDAVNTYLEPESAAAVPAAELDEDVFVLTSEKFEVVEVPDDVLVPDDDEILLDPLDVVDPPLEAAKLPVDLSNSICQQSSRMEV